MKPHLLFILIATLPMVATAEPGPRGRGKGVTSTLHNLSTSGPGNVRSMTESEVCKFCHIPHNAVQPVPLWAQALSEVQNYNTPTIRRSGSTTAKSPQPSGSSRLCLSCHDGTVALGEIGQTRKRIPMTGANYITPGRSGFIGTDLSGSHPISVGLEERDGEDGSRDMGIRPRATVLAEGTVRLDKDSKIQCTTCHDPHSDENYQEGKVPHFWPRATVQEVCLSCHELR